MPKYISRIQFEQMKVLKKRGGSNVAVGKALGMSPATVSRNNKYNSYEDYLVSMYGRSSKSQKEVEAKSGPVKVVGSGQKTCKKCGRTKPLEEFHKAKTNRDGYEGTCKECRYKDQRRREKIRKAATTAEAPRVGMVKEKPRKEENPDLVTWGFIAEELKKMHAPEKAKDEEKDDSDDDEIKVNECVYVDINDKVKRGVVIAINDVSYTPEYIVRLDTWFFRKEVRVNQCHIFRRGDI